MARELHDQRLQLEVLAGFANVLVGQNELFSACEYLGLALGHPQSNREIKTLLGQIQIQLAQRIGQDNFQRATTRGLERGLETTMLLLQNIKLLQLA